MSEGWTVVVGSNGQIRSQPSADLLVFNLPLPPNEVDEKALEALPGIGPVACACDCLVSGGKGPFEALDDLENVHGIGPKTVAAIGCRSSPCSRRARSQTDKRVSRRLFWSIWITTQPRRLDRLCLEKALPFFTATGQSGSDPLVGKKACVSIEEARTMRRSGRGLGQEM